MAGCEPDYMGLGPIYAVPKVMKKTGLTVSDMAVVELNEAFAAQAIPCMRKLGLDPAKTNPNGGAMALASPGGHRGLPYLQITGRASPHRRKIRHGHYVHWRRYGRRRHLQDVLNMQIPSGLTPRGKKGKTGTLAPGIR